MKVASFGINAISIVSCFVFIETVSCIVWHGMLWTINHRHNINFKLLHSMPVCETNYYYYYFTCENILRNFNKLSAVLCTTNWRQMSMYYRCHFARVSNIGFPCNVNLCALISTKVICHISIFYCRRQKKRKKKLCLTPQETRII